MLHRQAFFCEAFCGTAAKYEAQLTLHEAALRAMKRSLTASCGEYSHFSFSHYMSGANASLRNEMELLHIVK